MTMLKFTDIMNGETTVHDFQKVSEKYLKSICKYQILFKGIWIQIQILLQNLKSIWIQIPNTQKSICKYQIQVQIPNTVTTLECTQCMPHIHV